MKVLFVCAGNICRSPFAEGLARRLAAERGLDVEFASAGEIAPDPVGRGPDAYRQTYEQLHEKVEGLLA